MMATKQMSSRIWPVLAACILWVTAGSGAIAANASATETDSLISLSLEELLQVEVTTLSRQPQTLSSSPAAIFVVTQNDIRKSGARTIPDVLRMVPGLQVAQVDANTWAVTARGSNGVFANKLLVMQDGRSLYGPMYSGVRWDTVDTDFDAIDRIEVIRGPGAVMWGSNAVNGVINIITKNTADTHGFRADVVTGTYTDIETTLSWGGSVGQHLNYRIFGKYFDRDGFAPDNPATGQPYDAWDFGRVGGRVDWDTGGSDTLWLTAEYYDGTSGENFSANSITPPYSQSYDVETKPSGSFITANWNRDFSPTAGVSVQVYYDHAERGDNSPGEIRDTISLDFQNRFALGDRNNIIWGFEARHSRDRTEPSETITLIPAKRTQRLLSGFIQDEIRLFQDGWFLTVGTKVESNNFSQSDLTWSPNIRLSWLYNETTTVWASIAKAIRTPNRIEQDVQILGGVEPPMTAANPSPLPFAVVIHGNPEFDDEEVTAYELGYRTQPFDDITLDIALFYNKYKDMRYGTSLGVTCQPAGLAISDPQCFAGPPPTNAELGITFVNDGRQDSRGFELALSYIPFEWWRMDGAFTYLKIDGDDFSNLPLSNGEDVPQQQWSLRSNMSILTSGSLDLWLRYVDELQIQDIPSYLTLDARLAWHITNKLEVALVGRNLLESSHLEFREEFGANEPVEVQREALAELQWQF